MCGIDLDFRIVPFRGEYSRLPDSKNEIVKHLIYPVPDPKLPFLGVHLTPMIGGYVTVGPNAVLAMAREGYRRSAVDLKEVAGLLAFPGFWRVMRNHPGSAVTELKNSLWRRGYLAECRKFCPELTLDDLSSYPAGVRAQAVLRDGTLVHDFAIRRTKRTLHVCNAPSPAAMSAIPIAAYLVDQMSQAFEVGEVRRHSLLPSSSNAVSGEVKIEHVVNATNLTAPVGPRQTNSLMSGAELRARGWLAFLERDESEVARQRRPDAPMTRSSSAVLRNPSMARSVSISTSVNGLPPSRAIWRPRWSRLPSINAAVFRRLSIR